MRRDAALSRSALGRIGLSLCLVQNGLGPSRLSEIARLFSAESDPLGLPKSAARREPAVKARALLDEEARRDDIALHMGLSVEFNRLARAHLTLNCPAERYEGADAHIALDARIPCDDEEACAADLADDLTFDADRLLKDKRPLEASPRPEQGVERMCEISEIAYSIHIVFIVFVRERAAS